MAKERDQSLSPEARAISAKRDQRRLENSNPEKFGKILAMLAAGEGYRKINRTLNVDYQTLARIDREYAQDDLVKWKERAAREVEEAGKMVLQRMYEDLGDDEKMGKTSFKDKSISFAILKDKELLLRNEATSRVESVSGASVEAAARMIKEAQERLRIKRAEEAIDV